MKIQSLSPEPGQPGSLHSIIREIVRILDPEKILLLSASYQYQFTENIFIKNPVQESKGSRYELLILIHSGGNLSAAEQENRIASKFPDYGNLKWQLRDIHDFYEKAQAGSEFENFILLNAMLQYDKGTGPAAER